jgi:DNA-binding NtrC family response regulator
MKTSKYPEFGILIVDDEPAWLNSFSLTLECFAGITNLFLCQDSREVMGMLKIHDIGLVIMDLTMPHLSGEELLAQISEHHPGISTIVISGMNQVEAAVNCMKLGAFEYFVKTTEEDRLVNGVLRAIRMLELERENREMSNYMISGQLKHPDLFAAIVTKDRSMISIFSYLEAIAKSSQPLLITGESGVGKELIARAFHSLGGCRGSLVSINAAGLDDTVFSDTLFGHMRGAFTGADQVRRGMIEEAADGTIFLDEIGDLSISSQVKLLRLLQEGEYFPLGSDVPKKSKAKVVVSTHQNLAAKQADGAFRHDLYYRLCTHQVHVPPLRDRKGDIPLLLDYFLNEASRSLEKKKPTPPKELEQLLAAYNFPGNIRELQAIVYDAVSSHSEGTLSMKSFHKAMGRSNIVKRPVLSNDSEHNMYSDYQHLPTIRESVSQLVEEAMARAGSNQSIAARLLGITQSALCKRLKRDKDT